MAKTEGVAAQTEISAASTYYTYVPLFPKKKLQKHMKGIFSSVSD